MPPGYIAAKRCEKSAVAARRRLAERPEARNPQVRMTKTPESFLYLTTRGRRTGKPRRIEIWFVAHRGAFYLIAELGESAGWVQNIREHDGVELCIGTRDAEERDVPRTQARARVIVDQKEPELAEQVRALALSKYGWNDGLIVALEPEAA
jgi:deazaflavin-dependent oxidoreductase (nitroreductase family)